jgi:hypothetical protein
MEKDVREQEANRQAGYVHPDNFPSPIVDIEGGNKDEDDIPAPEQSQDFS